MASTIVTKNSSTASAVPVSGDLTQGELAVNVTDKKLYTKNSGGTVVELGTTPTSLTTGAISGTTLAASGAVTLSGGTANGVAYLNGSKVVTTGSALTFDGTNLGVLAGSVTTPAAKIHAVGSVRSSNGAGTIYSSLASDGVYATGTDLYLFAPTGYANIFYANNAEQMRLTSTGLGIGTSSPSAKLHVVSGAIEPLRWGSTTSGYNYITHLNVSSGVVGYLGDGLSAVTGYAATDYAIRANQGNLLFATNGNNVRAIIDTSGNLGLGVTPSAWNTYKALEIGRIGNYFAGYNGGTEISLGANAYYNTGWKYAITGALATRYMTDNSGGHYWYTAPSGTAGNAITFTQAMTLDASGNLGIGTTSPTSYANFIYQTIQGTNGAGISLRNTAGTTLSEIYQNSSGLGIVSISNLPIFFNTNNTERARIDSSGNLLVGCTSLPLDSSIAGISFTKTGIGAGQARFGKTYSGLTQAIYFGYNTTTVGTITYSDTATAYNTSSDYRLKDITGPLIGSGEFIDALQPKVGTWKADGSKFVGFLAHEVQEVSPGSVIGEKDAVDEEGNPIMQAMEYGSAEFIANIVAELQSLRKRVAELEGK